MSTLKAWTNEELLEHYRKEFEKALAAAPKGYFRDPTNIDKSVEFHPTKGWSFPRNE